MMAWKVSGLSQSPAIMALAAGLDALCDGGLTLARKEFDRAHFAEIHAHGVVGAQLNPEDLAKITDFTLSHYNEHAEDFWEGTRDHNVNQNIAALLQSIEGEPRKRQFHSSANVRLVVEQGLGEPDRQVEESDIRHALI